MRYALYSLPLTQADNCGNAILNPGWSHPERKLPSSVLILGRKGCAVIDEEGERLEIRPSRIALLAAGRRHKGATPIESPASYFWIHFTASEGGLSLLDEEDAGTILSNADIVRHRLVESALLPQSLDLKDDEPFAQYFHALFYEQESPSYTPLRYQAIFREMLIALTERVIESRRSSRDEAQLTSIVYAVIAEISEHLTDTGLSVKSIATSLRLNPDYLGRRFKDVMGISIGSYILKKRIRIAEERLQLSHDTVKEVAERCGFGTMRHFLRQFKGERGMTPTDMRLHYLARHINNQ
jgi:AraC-like DNA-binding protein